MTDNPAKNPYALQDPTKQYPQPKFKRQTQKAPGSGRKMMPRPDHGEMSYRGSGRLPNRKALVTGGDSGIGRAAAIAFAREGADVAINYLPSEEEDAKEVIALIEKEGRKAIALPGDISNEKVCRKLINDAHRKLGGLDILACVAGKQHAVEKIADLTTKQLEATYRVNVFALFWLCQEALPLMPPGGSIITTASIQATHPSPSLRGIDHHNCIHSGDPSQSEPTRLCADQGRDPGIYEGTGPSGCRRWD
jgi:hypothetical protein